MQSLIRVLFLTRSLECGGAERQLIELVRHIDKQSFQVTVVTFYDGGWLRSELEAVPGITVCSLHKGGRWDVLPLLPRLLGIFRRIRPHIVHGYMAPSNELSLLGRLVGARSVWGLRASNLDLSQYDRVAAMLFKAGARLSRFADLIIVNSHAGRSYHVAQGYAARRMLVIQNGIDTQRFRPDVEARKSMRAGWGIGQDVALIGLVGRLDPMKDHDTFLKAAALLRQRKSNVRFICIGEGPAEYKSRLLQLSKELGIADCVTWQDNMSDMTAAYNAMDVAALSSRFGEGFPNVVGEAMACAIPCVVTDVGDAALIVETPEQVVPISNPEAMSLAWERLLEKSPDQRLLLGSAARERIVSSYSTLALAKRTEAELKTIAPRSRTRRTA